MITSVDDHDPTLREVECLVDGHLVRVFAHELWQFSDLLANA